MMLLLALDGGRLCEPLLTPVPKVVSDKEK